MEDLLKEASNKLQMAIANLEENNDGSRRLAVTDDKAPITSTIKMAAADASSPSPQNAEEEEGYDLDGDFAAAAFFERQARKKDAENKLRVDEWAQTTTFYQFIATGDKSNINNQEEGTMGEEASVLPVTTQIMDRQNLADVLYKEFKNGFT